VLAAAPSGCVRQQGGRASRISSKDSRTLGQEIGCALDNHPARMTRPRVLDAPVEIGRLCRRLDAQCVLVVIVATSARRSETNDGVVSAQLRLACGCDGGPEVVGTGPMSRRCSTAISQAGETTRSCCTCAVAPPPDDVWAAHCRGKDALIETVFQRTGRRLRTECLTIGFARRATGYKRIGLVLSDLVRCAASPPPIRCS
jgi:hypothetical protein